ncbi:MAG TPA: hypothetical protein VKR06_13395 [Ktedonosporobacter sp.]|nr:hypothetical protein [Ktedonosporobacter sp.]
MPLGFVPARTPVLSVDVLAVSAVHHLLIATALPGVLLAMLAFSHMRSTSLSLTLNLS